MRIELVRPNIPKMLVYRLPKIYENVQIYRSKISQVLYLAIAPEFFEVNSLKFRNFDLPLANCSVCVIVRLIYSQN